MLPRVLRGMAVRQPAGRPRCASLLVCAWRACASITLTLLPSPPPAAANPLLHAAKICNQLSLGPLKIGGFLVFAAVFFVSRVLLVPWAVLKPALLDSRWAHQHLGVFFVFHSLVCCGPWAVLKPALLDSEGVLTAAEAAVQCLHPVLPAGWTSETAAWLLCCLLACEPAAWTATCAAPSTAVNPRCPTLPLPLMCRAVIPYVLADFPAIYWGVNALLALLYVLQLMWMNGIVRVVRCAAGWTKTRRVKG